MEPSSELYGERKLDNGASENNAKKRTLDDKFLYQNERPSKTTINIK